MWGAATVDGLELIGKIRLVFEDDEIEHKTNTLPNQAHKPIIKFYWYFYF
jgi:hypothetical protein